VAHGLKNPSALVHRRRGWPEGPGVELLSSASHHPLSATRYLLILSWIPAFAGMTTLSYAGGGGPSPVRGKLRAGGEGRRTKFAPHGLWHVWETGVSKTTRISGRPADFARICDRTHKCRTNYVVKNNTHPSSESAAVDNIFDRFFNNIKY